MRKLPKVCNFKCKRNNNKKIKRTMLTMNIFKKFLLKIRKRSKRKKKLRNK